MSTGPVTSTNTDSVLITIMTNLRTHIGDNCDKNNNRASGSSSNNKMMNEGYLIKTIKR